MPARSSDYISPPPFGPSARNDQVHERTAAANKTHSRQQSGKGHASKPLKLAVKLANPRAQLHALEKPPLQSHIGSAYSSLPNKGSILPPVTGRDVAALIFVFLLVPQGISCLLLLGYIMSGTFRGLAARFLARFSVLVEERLSSIWGSHSSPSHNTSSGRQRHWFYSRAVAGEFLQLFSINSIILLICHYTMPRLWTHYLLVMAKLIVASRLVGTYTVGTTTYVSVVSGGQSTTTTTSTPNSLLSQGATGGVLDKAKYLKSSFVNSLLGFASVTAIDTLIRHWLQHLNVPQLVSDLARFYRGVWHFGLLSPSSDSAKTSDYLKAFFTKSPFFVTYNYLSKRKDRYYSLGIKRGNGMRLSILDRLIIHIAVRFFNIDDTSLHSLTLVLQEISTIINYAYLVLCIHVISLTISPFLQKFFIFKDYSKNLDHLSSLTPSIPLSGDRHSSVPSNASLADPMMVVNVDQLQSANTPSQPTVVEVDQEIASSAVESPFSDTNVSAKNFEVFCLVPPTSKVVASGNKPQQNRTIVDRKRANSNALPPPSTTIVDRCFTTSIQPLWSWVAAIKVFFINSNLFNGQSTSRKECGSEFLEMHSDPQLMSIIKLGDREVVLELTDESLLKDTITVQVNSIPWDFVTKFTQETPTGNRTFIKVEGLQPLCQYEIRCDADNEALASVTVNTTDHSKEKPYLEQSVHTSSLETLQGSLTSTIDELNELRWNHKKQRKDENKKITDLKKQVDSMRAKVEKANSRVPIEGRGSGKLKGLQYSVIQLEHEVEDLHKQLDSMKESNETVDGDLKMEEQAMLEQIQSLEAFIEDHELSTGQLKNDIRAVENERNNVAVKHRKLQSKVRARKEEISRLNAEIKGMKKAVLGRYQRRQKRVQERFDTILPKVQVAGDELSQELGEYVQ